MTTSPDVTEGQTVIRTITWHTEKTAPKDGVFFSFNTKAKPIGSVNVTRWVGNDDGQPKAFMDINFGARGISHFTHWTRDKVTP